MSFLARIGLFAAAGALFSLPFGVHEIWSTPSAALSGMWVCLQAKQSGLR